MTLASANNELFQQQLYKLSELSVPEKSQESYSTKLLNLNNTQNLDTHSQALLNILRSEAAAINSDITGSRELLNVAKPLMEAVDSSKLEHVYQFAELFLLREEGYINEALAVSVPLYEATKAYWSKSQLCELVLEIAYVQSLATQYTKSIESLELALTYASQIKDPYQFAQTYNLFGIVYSDLNDHVSAVTYFEKAIAIQAQHPEFGDLLYTYGNLADTYRALENYDKALEIANESLVLSKEQNDPAAISFSHQVLSRILVDQKEYEQALNHILITKQILEESGGELFNFEIYSELAHIYLNLGQLDKSEDSLNKAQVYSRQQGSAEEFYLHRLRSDLLVAKKNYRQAYEELKTSYRQYRESYNTDLTLVSDLARKNLDQEKLSFENKLLEQENKLNAEHLAESKSTGTIQMILILLLLATIGVLVWGILRYKHLASDNKRLALTDNLTQLPNRRSVFRTLDRKHQQCLKAGESEHYSIILFDIDHFKSVNDRFGHTVGDATIQATSDICHAVLREGDTIGRIGGEEFLIILPKTEISDAYQIAERLRASFEQYDFEQLAEGLKVTSSFGVTQYSPEDETLDIVINRADNLLYKAKKGGRNLVCC